MNTRCALAVFVLTAGVYVGAQAPPQPPAGGGRQGAPPPGRGGGGMLAGAGPSDKPVVDPAAADRGRRTWASECINCHGTQARGNDNGPNLVRSVIVLRDRYGSQLGPFLAKGHKLQSGASGASLSEAQVQDLAHFLRQRVNDGLRGSPLFQAQNVLTGDAKAGAAFFNGEGKCTTCHSTTGNLAGIGSRLEPIDIQQRFLFPNTGRGGRGGRGRGAGAAPSPTSVVRVTVTPPGGQALSGALVQMDDFFVSLRQDDGTQHTVRRVAGMKVERLDPFAFHIELLDRLTDKNMHDIVAYLETLK
jgi:cytochrome c oxidase cbb3-type subunit 3